MNDRVSEERPDAASFAAAKAIYYDGRPGLTLLKVARLIDAFDARIRDCRAELAAAPQVECACHPGVRWPAEQWGKECPISEAQANAARLEALGKKWHHEAVEEYKARAALLDLLRRALDAMDPMTDPWMPDVTKELLADLRAALAKEGEMTAAAMCDTCWWVGPDVRFHKGQGRADGRTTDVPWALADHWLCPLCVEAGFEVHQGRINAGLVRMLNVVRAVLAKEG